MKTTTYAALTPFDPRGPRRGCLNLTWRTTRQTSQERPELRRDYLEALLNEDRELRRPYRMRVKVFDALVNELAWLEMWG